MKLKCKGRGVVVMIVMMVCAGFGVVGGPEVASVVAEIACEVIESGS